MMEWAGVPRRFIEHQFPLPDFLAGSVGGIRGAFLHGTAGTGKTTMAVALLREDILLWGWNGLAENEQAFRSAFNRRRVSELFMFTTFPELILSIQDSWRDESGRSAKNIIDSVSKVETLILDDVGAEKTTDFGRQTLYLILNRREGDIRKTSLTSNASPAVLDQQFDQRVSSRVGGLCNIFEVHGRDRRLDR